MRNCIDCGLQVKWVPNSKNNIAKGGIKGSWVALDGDYGCTGPTGHHRIVNESTDNHIHETVGKRIEVTFSDMNSGESFIDSAETHTVDNLGLYNTGAWQLRDVEDSTVYYIFDREIHDGSIKVIGDTPERKTFVYYETYTESRHIAVELDADATEEQIRNAAYAFKSDEWEGDSYEVTDTEIKDADGNLVKFEAE